MANCIKCDGEIINYGFNGINFEVCKKCGLVIISKDNFEKLVKKVDVGCKIVDLFELPPIVVKNEVRKCHHCNDDMEQVYCEGVLIDRCKKCNLLMFDNGEFSKYFSIFSSKNMEIMNNIAFLKKYCNEVSIAREVKTEMKIQSKESEKIVPHTSGWAMVFIELCLVLLIFTCFILNYILPGLIVFSVLIGILAVFLLSGFRILKPQEALIYTMFGNYYGTLRTAGFHWVNPLAASGFGSISLKARTLDNDKQKINDVLGNPIEVGIMVTWEVKDTAKAIFNVNDFQTFLSAQCDSALRNIVRLYPYDAPEDSNKQTLKDDSVEISEKLKQKIQESVSAAGINIIDARITHLAYSSEIAMAMLQRQQANAVIDAKKAIVEGAVGMVEMAIEKLSQNENIVLDDKTKASMVNNLLVILCGNKESQPVIRNDNLG